MSSEPLVSLFIPASRAVATLPGAVPSLLAQTHPCWQAIGSGRCAALEEFLDLTGNGRAPWVDTELARVNEEPARAA